MTLPSQFVLSTRNSFGLGVYTLMTFGSDGYPDPVTPVIHARNGGGGTQFNWPSIVAMPGGITRIYAHRLVAGKWQDLAVWESTAGGPYVYQGLALDAIGGETGGIGPSQVFLAPGEARPFKCICLSRDSGFSSFFIASSITGEAGTWSRDGVVLTKGESWEVNGISVSYVLKLPPPDGRWALLYQAYDTGDIAHGAIAYAETLGSTFTGKTKIVSPNGLVHSAQTSAIASGRITTTGALIMDEPYAIGAPNGALEVVIPRKQVGQEVFIDRPLVFGYPAGSSVAHFGRRKIDPVYVYQKPDLTWEMWATCYTILSASFELVAVLTAPAIEGPWTFSKTGPRFSPYGAHEFTSCENPSPLMDATAL